jgi:hypothetical protein
LKHVVAGRYDGAGARIVSIINAMRLANRAKCDFHFLWPSGTYFKKENISHIFSVLFIKKYYIDERYILDFWADCPRILKGVDGGRIFPDTDPEDRVLEISPEAAFKYNTWLINNNYGFYCFPDESVSIVKKNLSKMFLEESIFHKNIYNHLDLFFREISKDKELVGVHVRRGDIVNFEKDQWRIIDLTQYFEALKNISWDYIVLCTDSDDIIEEFNNKYGNLVLNDGLKQEVRVMEVDAITDILKLARCKNIFGGKSAFSEASRLIGNSNFHLLKKKEEGK